MVGAKANNLATLRSKLPEWILVPRSVALPFGTFEAVLADPANADVARQLREIEGQLAAAAAAAKAAAAGSSNGHSSNGHSSNGNGSNGHSSSKEQPVVLLARARELVERHLQAPEGAQQVGRWGGWMGAHGRAVLLLQVVVVVVGMVWTGQRSRVRDSCLALHTSCGNSLHTARAAAHCALCCPTGCV